MSRRPEIGNAALRRVGMGASLCAAILLSAGTARAFTEFDCNGSAHGCVQASNTFSAFPSVGGVSILGDSTADWQGTGVYGKSSSGRDVAGAATTGIAVFGSSDSGNGVWGSTNSSTNAAVVGQSPSNGLSFYGTGGIIITASLAQKPGSTTWTNPSDQRIKRNVTTLDRGLPELMKIRPVRYKYNGLGGTVDDGKEYVGVIAQELEKILPEMVGSRMGKLRPSDSGQTAIETVDASEFTFLLINAVQQQQRVIDRQEARLRVLEDGRAPMASSMLPLGPIGTGVALGMLPLGFVAAFRRRKNRA
jgi:hypothetical protein